MGLLASLRSIITSWWHKFLSRHPRPAVGKCDCPELDTDPVRPGEILLRRVTASRFKDGLVKVEAFDPSNDDTDGISFFRECFVDAGTLAANGKHEAGYVVVRLPAKDLMNLKLVSGREIKLELIPTPSDLPGHVILPSVRRGLEPEAKRLMKEIREALRNLANCQKLQDFRK